MYKYNVGILTPVRLQAGRMAENGNTVQKLRVMIPTMTSVKPNNFAFTESLPPVSTVEDASVTDCRSRFAW